MRMLTSKLLKLTSAWPQTWAVCSAFRRSLGTRCSDGCGVVGFRVGLRVQASSSYVCCVCRYACMHACTHAHNFYVIIRIIRMHYMVVRLFVVSRARLLSFVRLGDR